MEVCNERLRIYAMPDPNSEVVCEVEHMGQIIISPVRSTEDYYMVYTVFGVDGFCNKGQLSKFEEGVHAWKVY